MDNDSPKSKRILKQDVLVSLKFDVLEIYGHALQDEDVPSLLTVDLYPGSFERLLMARRAIKHETSLAGMAIRKEDISTDIGDNRWNGVYVLLQPSRSGYYAFRMHCFSNENGTFLRAYREISEDWFKAVFSKLKNQLKNQP